MPRRINTRQFELLRTVLTMMQTTQVNTDLLRAIIQILTEQVEHRDIEEIDFRSVPDIILEGHNEHNPYRGGEAILAQIHSILETVDPNLINSLMPRLPNVLETIFTNFRYINLAAEEVYQIVTDETFQFLQQITLTLEDIINRIEITDYNILQEPIERFIITFLPEALKTRCENLERYKKYKHIEKEEERIEEDIEILPNYRRYSHLRTSVNNSDYSEANSIFTIGSASFPSLSSDSFSDIFETNYSIGDKTLRVHVEPQKDGTILTVDPASFPSSSSDSFSDTFAVSSSISDRDLEIYVKPQKNGNDISLNDISETRTIDSYVAATQARVAHDGRHQDHPPASTPVVAVEPPSNTGIPIRVGANPVQHVDTGVQPDDALAPIVDAPARSENLVTVAPNPVAAEVLGRVNGQRPAGAGVLGQPVAAGALNPAGVAVPVGVPNPVAAEARIPQELADAVEERGCRAACVIV